jgi:hypothetical protein
MKGAPQPLGCSSQFVAMQGFFISASLASDTSKAFSRLVCPCILCAAVCWRMSPAVCLRLVLHQLGFQLFECTLTSGQRTCSSSVCGT